MKRMNVLAVAAAILISPAIAQAQDSWTEYPSCDEAFSRHGMAAVGASLVVFGGCDPRTGLTSLATRRYDTVTDSWSQGADLPAARIGMGSAALGGLVYCVGGFDDSDSVVADTLVYDPEADTWGVGPTLKEARAETTCVVGAGMLYAIGGTDGGAILSTVEILTFAGSEWEPGPSMPSARSESFASSIGLRIYVAGGRTDAGAITPSAMALDTVRGAWAFVTPLPVAIRDGASGSLSGRMFCVGGATAGGPYAGTLEYSPNLDTWTSRAAAPILFESGRGAVIGSQFFAMGTVATPDDALRLVAYAAPSYGASPNAPASMTQATVDGHSLYEGTPFPGSSIKLGASVTDAEPGNVRLEIEVRAEGEAFSYWPTQTGAMAAPGSRELTVSLDSLGRYRWQARTVDVSGNASEWVSFGDVALYDFESATPADATGPTDGLNGGPAQPPGPTSTERTGGSSGGSGGCGGSAAGGQGAAGAVMALLLAAGTLRGRKE